MSVRQPNSVRPATPRIPQPGRGDLPFHASSWNDPTSTTRIRNEYHAALKRPLNAIAQEIQRGIAQRDVLGFSDTDTATTSTNPTGEGVGERVPGLRGEEFRGQSKPVKINRFLGWFETALSATVESLASDESNPWVDAAYVSGINFAHRLFATRDELPSVIPTDEVQEQLAPGDALPDTGFNLPSALDGEGELTVEEMDAMLGTERHRDETKALYSRNKRILDGITTDTMSDTAHIVTSRWGDTARTEAARKIVAQDIKNAIDSGVTRTKRMAAYETATAFNTAAAVEYSRVGIEKVGVITASDACPDCVIIAEGGPYTPEVVMSDIPQHPHCRCAVVPDVVF